MPLKTILDPAIDNLELFIRHAKGALGALKKLNDEIKGMPNLETLKF